MVVRVPTAAECVADDSLSLLLVLLLSRGLVVEDVADVDVVAMVRMWLLTYIRICVRLVRVLGDVGMCEKP